MLIRLLFMVQSGTSFFSPRISPSLMIKAPALESMLIEHFCHLEQLESL